MAAITAFMSRLIRFSIVLLGILLACAILLFIVGGRSRNYSAQVQINATPEVVFKYLTDSASLSQWLANVEQVEPLTEGGHRVGAKARVTVNENGRRYQIVDEVIASERNQSLLVASTTPQADIRSDFRLEPSGTDRTVVKYTLVLSPKGLFRLIVPWIGNRFDETISDQLKDLKKLIESKQSAQ